jgi:hypothetical protein
MSPSRSCIAVVVSTRVRASGSSGSRRATSCCGEARAGSVMPASVPGQHAAAPGQYGFSVERTVTAPLAAGGWQPSPHAAWSRCPPLTRLAKDAHCGSLDKGAVHPIRVGVGAHQGIVHCSIQYLRGSVPAAAGRAQQRMWSIWGSALTDLACDGAAPSS